MLICLIAAIVAITIVAIVGNWCYQQLPAQRAKARAITYYLRFLTGHDDERPPDVSDEALTLGYHLALSKQLIKTGDAGPSITPDGEDFLEDRGF